MVKKLDANEDDFSNPSDSELDAQELTVQFLNQIIQTQGVLVNADFNLEAFMQLVVNKMLTLTPAQGVVVELVEGDEMVYKSAVGNIKDYLGLRLLRKGSISGLCVQEAKVLSSEDTELDPRVNREATRKVHARSLVVAPLFFKSKTIGVLKIMASVPNAFSTKDIKTLQLMAGFIAAGIAHQITFDENKKLLEETRRTLEKLKVAQDQLEHLATYDTLTDLPNRRLFLSRLSSAISRSNRTHQLIALIYLDIDHFKQINDTLGHAAGDELLKAFALRIKNGIRGYDTAARLGGDEFIVLIENLSHEEDAVAVAMKIKKEILKPYQLNNERITITSSLGIAFKRDKLTNSDTLIRQADQALYTAKETGRNRMHVFGS